MTSKKALEARKAPGPKARALLDSGDAFLEHATVIGIAHDKVEVILGSLYSPETLEAYLTEFPTPTDW